LGMLSVPVLIALGAGPYLFVRLAELTGGTEVSFGLVCGLALAGAACMWLLGRRPFPGASVTLV
ncbi:MAG TPA: hypothetical protein VGA44_00495, partial [Steroidobacteraceae bacterium]